MNTCYNCGTDEKELRPYGPNMSWVCFDCAMKPENKKQTESSYIGQLEAASKESAIVVLGEVTGPRPYYGKDVL